MRLRSTLLDIATIVTTALASTGCGSSQGTAPIADAAADAIEDDGRTIDAATESGEDSAVPMESGIPGDAGDAATCNSASGSVSPDQACALVGQDMPFSSTPSTNVVSGAPCESYCDGLCPGASGGADPTYWRCTVTQGYVDAFRAAQPDAGAADGGQDAGLVCPQWSSQVVIQCGPPPVGRGTEGATGPALCPDAGVAGVGSELADRAYLEAVSVHAFARLERELERHGAPPALLRDVRRARRDEVRHTAMMSRLARRFGGTPRAFATPAARPVRSLLAIALENAVEGCVRETYGAVVGLIEARTSSDAAVRRTMRSIAEDECRHAELAWAVAAWIAPRLTEDERRTVDGAMRRAVETLRQEGESRIVGLLTKRLWTEQARMAA